MKGFILKNYKKLLIVIPLIVTTLLLYLFSIKPHQTGLIIEDSSSKDKISLKTGDKYESEILIKDNNLKGIEIYNNDIKYYFHLTNEHLIMNVKIYTEGKVFYQEQFTQLEQEKHMLLFKEPLKNYKDKNIKISFEVEETEDNIALLLNNNGHIRANQISGENDFYIIFFLFGIFIVFSILYTTKFINYNKIKIFNNKIIKVIYIPIYFIINLIFSFLCLYLIYKAHYLNYIPITLLTIEIILLFIIIFIGTYIIKTSNGKVEKWFLALAVPISCMFCAMFLPNDGQDEYRHYGAIYRYVTAQSISTKEVEVPDVIITKKYTIKSLEQFFLILKSDYNYENTKILKAAGYNPLLYIFSIPGVFIAKLLELNPYIGWYLGKIFNMIITIIIFYYIIKRIPKYKKLLMTYMLIPGVIYQFVTLSADTTINISTLLLLCISVDYYFNNRNIRKRDWLLIIISTIIMSSAKPIYYPFILICLILMRKSITKTKKDIYSIIINIILPLIIYIGWQKLISSTNLIETVFKSNNSINIGFKYLFYHPLQGIIGFLYQIIKETDQYVLNFIGWRFNWAGGNVPYSYTILYILILLFSSLIPENKNKKLDKISTIVTLFISISIFCLMILFWMYCEVRSNIFTNTMYGLCGRYYIPIFIWFLICLSNINILKEKKENIIKYDKFLIFSICFISYMYIHTFIQLLFV